VPAVRLADLSGGIYGEDEEGDGDEDEDVDNDRSVSAALRACIGGEGEPPLELVLAAVVCAGSGEVLGVPVQRLREEGDLVKMDLSRSGIGADGARLLALLLPMCKLVTLSLKGNGLGDEDAKHVAEALAVNTTLAHINLLLNEMGEEGAKAIVSVAKDKPHITTLCGIKPDQTRANFQTRPKTRPNWFFLQLNVGDAILLAFDLQRNSTLRELELDVHPLQIKQLKGEEPAEVIDLSRRTATADCSDGPSYKGIGIASAVVIASLIGSNTVTKSLNLRYNGLNAEAAEHLAGALTINSTLQELNLSGEPFGPPNIGGAEGAMHIAEALKVNSTLTMLNLANNAICDDGEMRGLVALCETLKSNSSLRELNLADNKLTNYGSDMSGIVKLSEALKENNGLTSLECAHTSPSLPYMAAVNAP